MSLKVVYDQKNCTAAKECSALRPEFWKNRKDGKAVLKGGKLNPATGKFELAISKKELAAIKESALVCPAYVIDIVDTKTKASILKLKPTREADKDKAPVVRASYDSRTEWKMDPKGFFTIKPDAERGTIRVRYYGPKHDLKLVVEGKNAEEIANTIVRKKLVSLLQHAAYLGIELAKAELAMKKNLPYVQDSPLP